VAVLAVMLAVAPVPAQSVPPDTAAALDVAAKLSLASEALHASVLTHIVRVKVEGVAIGADNLPEGLQKDFEDFKQRWQQEHPEAETQPGAEVPTIRPKPPRRPGNDMEPPPKGRMIVRQNMPEAMMVRRFLEARSQDPATGPAARQLLNRLEALRGKANGELLGVLLDDQGTILTLTPAFANRPRGDKVTVLLPNNTEVKAELLGSEPQRGLTLLKLDDVHGLKPAVLTPAALAPAAPNGGALLFHVSTTGTVGWAQISLLAPSALRRSKPAEAMPVIAGADDRAGSFLFAINGTLAGVVLERQVVTAPALAEDIRALREKGYIPTRQFGVRFSPILPRDPLRAQITALGHEQAIRVEEVFPDSLAEASGLLVGDVILALDGKPLSEAAGALLRIGQQDRPVKLALLRAGKEIELSIQRPKRPPVQ
jgi:S1-C subfamily serine protease